MTTPSERRDTAQVPVRRGGSARPLDLGVSRRIAGYAPRQAAKAQDVILTLSRLMRLYGKPAFVRSDHGAKAKVLIERWRWFYNAQPPHSAHGYKPRDRSPERVGTRYHQPRTHCLIGYKFHTQATATKRWAGVKCTGKRGRRCQPSQHASVPVRYVVVADPVHVGGLGRLRFDMSQERQEFLMTNAWACWGSTVPLATSSAAKRRSDVALVAAGAKPTACTAQIMASYIRDTTLAQHNLGRGYLSCESQSD